MRLSDTAWNRAARLRDATPRLVGPVAVYPVSRSSAPAELADPPRLVAPMTPTMPAMPTMPAAPTMPAEKKTARLPSAPMPSWAPPVATSGLRVDRGAIGRDEGAGIDLLDADRSDPAATGATAPQPAPTPAPQPASTPAPPPAPTPDPQPAPAPAPRTRPCTTTRTRPRAATGTRPRAATAPAPAPEPAMPAVDALPEPRGPEDIASEAETPMVEDDAQLTARSRSSGCRRRCPSRCGVTCPPGGCTRPEHRWQDERMIPWQMFAQGEYVGPARLAHVPVYHLRVDDIIHMIYGFTGQPSTTPYELAVGDVVQIDSNGDPKVDRSVTVQPDGMVTLRYLGQVQAAGLNLDELQNDLESRYKKYIREPAVTITPVKLNSRLDQLRETVDQRYGPGGLGVSVRVTPAGTVQLPSIGSLPVQGLTLDEVKREIEARYARRFHGVEVTPVLEARAALPVRAGRGPQSGPVRLGRSHDRVAGDRDGGWMERRGRVEASRRSSTRRMLAIDGDAAPPARRGAQVWIRVPPTKSGFATRTSCWCPRAGFSRPTT